MPGAWLWSPAAIRVSDRSVYYVVVDVDSQLPRTLLSQLHVIGELPDANVHAPEDERPLFAATATFARRQGGPITRAFVDSLPAAWGTDVVVDSSLVWLLPGLVHDDDHAGRGAHRGPACFRHEPFPGATTGVRDRANRNRASLHRWLVIGEPGPRFATGEIRLDEGEDPEAFWLPGTELAPRDERIRRWLADGTLVATDAPTATVFEHGWGTLWCPRRATEPGFQLVLRATHRDVRPHVDGIRNAILV